MRSSTSAPARHGLAALITVLTALALTFSLLALVAPSAEAARNKAPKMKPIGAQKVRPGKVLVVRAKARDRDHGPRVLRYRAKGKPRWLKLNRRTGVLRGRAPARFAGRAWKVTLRVTDGRATTKRRFRVKIRANRPPRISPISNRNLVAGQRLIVRPAATDPDRGPRALRYSVSYRALGTSPSRPRWLRMNARTGYLIGTAPRNAVGDRWRVTVAVRDGLRTARRGFTLRVIAPPSPNRAPSITDAGPFTIEQGPSGIEVGRVSGTDPDGDRLRWSLLTSGVPFAMKAGGMLVTTEALDHQAAEKYDVDVSASDGRASDTAVVTIHVTQANQAPIVEPIADVTVQQDAAITAIPVQASDPDGHIVKVTAGGLPDGLTLSDDGTRITGTPTEPGTYAVEIVATDDEGMSGSTSFTVTVEGVETGRRFQVAENSEAGTVVGTVGTDGVDALFSIEGGNTGDAFAIDPDSGEITVQGALDHEGTEQPYTLDVRVTAGGEDRRITVTIMVLDVNEAPVVTAIDDRSATEDEAIDPIPVEVTDPDQGDTATVAVEGLPGGVEYADGTITGTPTTPGEYAVTVTATDGASLAGSAEFTLTVANVNDAPVIVPVDDVAATEDEAIAPITVTATDGDDDEVTLDVSDLPAGLTWDAATGTISGTPTEAGDFSVTVTADDGNGGTATDTFAIAVEGVNDAPAIESIDPASLEGTVDESLEQVVTVVATDEDGDVLALSADGLPEGLEATDNGDGTVTVSGTPTEAGETTASIVATDPDEATDTAELTVTIADEATGCSPISTLPCAEVPVELPYELSFDGTEGGLGDTGFTMVDPPSQRDNVDQSPAPATPTHPDVPGYEPDLVATTDGTLGLTATKGIAYREPSVSARTNSQLNTLGVGVSGAENGYEVETTVVAPTFPGSGNDSQQGGLWFGLGEDDFVKAAVARVNATTNKVQIVTEIGAEASPGTVHELNSASFPAGEDVRLVLRVEDTTGGGGEVSLQYAVGDGEPVQLTDSANTVDERALPIPQSFLDGKALALLDGEALAGDAGQSSFAGTYATKRNAPASEELVVDFENFQVRELEVEPEVHERFVFQPDPAVAGQVTPEGYTVHDGSAYSDDAGHGFVTEESLAEETTEPLDMTSNTRYRNRSGVSALHNSLIHLQYADSLGTPNPAHNLEPGAFELAVPDGWYAVKVSVGDQGGGTNGYDSRHTVNLEGVSAIDAFQGSAAQEYTAVSRTVQVTDGRLTLDALGGTNTKINYLEVDTTSEPVETDIREQVRFSDEASAPPGGYVKDFGQAYGERTGVDQGTGLTYGWRALATDQPLSLVGNGRNRNTGANPPAGVSALQAGLMHMQLPANADGGVKTPGYWEMAVPNGAYEVSVSAGDATSVDSEHWLNIEGQNAVAEFVPTGGNGAATHWTSATRTVTVSDGRLTLTPESGVNTKINWVTLDSVPGASQRPSVLKSTPANLATEVSPTGSVVTDLQLVGSGVEPATLDATTVALTEVATGEKVPANVITSGGADVINLSPNARLEDDTLYRFSVTEGVTDVDDRAFLPYSTVFTTGSGTGGGGPVAFDKSDSGAPAASQADMGYSSIVKGPDGRMYVGTLGGTIYRFDIAADGSLTNRFAITSVRDYSAGATSGDTYHQGTRSVIGMAFDPASTPTNPILWISDNAPYVGQADVPDSSGRIARLTGANLQNYTAVVDGLPRSVKDHEANSVAFGPDGALYLNVGANNAMGAPDGAWANRAERLLSAAVLRLDPAKLPATLPARGVDVRTGDAGDYDPFAANAPLTIYARGVRNAYDLVWHSNGHLYVPTNGSAAGGNVPAVPSDANLPATCANRPDGTYVGRPKVAGVTNNPEETDYVFDVKKDGYYGHPNPSRCEYVLNNGNPTSAKDPFENSKYPVGTAADPNYDLAGVYDAGVHASANGVIEYQSNAFGGSLKGKLIYVRYSNGQDLVTFDVAANGGLSNRTAGITGFTGFNQPLDVTEDTATGNLYVTQLGNGTISLVKPQGGGGGPVAEATDRLVFSGPTNATSETRDAVVQNTGIDDLVVTGASFGGTHAGQFARSGGPAFPVTVEAGDTVSIPVAFAPTTTGVKNATLDLATDAGAKTVRLRGLAMAGYEGGHEPSLQRIMDAYEIPIDVGDPDPSNSSMPNTQGMIGDEVPAQLFQKAAFDAPISITPLAAFGPRSHQVHVGWHDAGQGDGVHRQYTIPAEDLQGLMVDTDGETTNIDPGEETAFGIYSEWPAFDGRRAYTEDALNTWDSALPHHVRVYPFKTPDGVTVPDTFVLATEEIPGSFDSQDIVLLVENVKPYLPDAADAVLEVTNPDPTPFEDQITFSKLQTTAFPAQKYADLGTARISNDGTEPMLVTGLTATDTFALVNPPELPLTLAPGETEDLSIRFTATGTRVHQGTLTVQSNAGNGSQSIRLAGLWQSRSEGGQEPSLVQIARAFGMGSDIPTDLNGQGKVETVGDEVFSPFWKRADGSSPVTIRQLAAYHGPGGNGVNMYAQNGGDVNGGGGGHHGDWHQSVLPSRNTAGDPTLVSVASPPTTFGFRIGSEYSDPTRNNSQVDIDNGCVAPCGHHVRFFAVEDSDGTPVPGTYLMTMDFAGVNYDYNDNTYLITNVKPKKLRTPQGLGASAGDGEVTLSWSPTPDEGVSYRVWRDTDADVPADSAHLVSGEDALTEPTFTDTTVTNGTTYYYVVRAVIPGEANSDSTTAVAATPNDDAAFVEQVNFQSEAAPVPDGYLPDFGQPFGARTGPDQGSGLSYGWIEEDGEQPLDLSVGGNTPGNGRDRDLQDDQRLDTLMHMQAADVPAFNGTAANGRWEMAVPDGSYAVTVAVGDAANNSDPEIHTLNVEGVTAVEEFVPSGGAGTASHHETATVTVTVEDGRLTLDAVGGTNTKIDYVDIAAAN